MTRSALPRIGLLALIWGSAFLWIKLADRGFSPVEVTLARLALGAAVLFAIVLARREPIPRSGRLWAHIAVAALFANAVPYLLFAVAEQTVDSSTAGIINATTPLWTVVLALAVRHQKTRDELAGGRADRRVRRGGADLHALAYGGRAVLGRWPGMPGRLDQLRDQLHLHGQVPGPPGHWPGRAVGLPARCARRSCSRSPWRSLAYRPRISPPRASRRSSVLGIIGTGFAYVLNYQIITSEGATVASTVTYLLPVVAIVLGVLVLGESITGIVLAGIALVLAGVALTRRRAKPATDEPNPRPKI